MTFQTPSIVFLVLLISAAIFCAAVCALLRRANKTAGVLGIVLAVSVLWFSREFQPWMPTGRAVHISSSHIGQYDFQVWQLKNNSITEPFTTGLFVRREDGRWRIFLLDFEDTYRPSIDLRKDSSGIAVFEDGDKLGVIDLKEATLVRTSDGASFHGTDLTSPPPSNWLPK